MITKLGLVSSFQIDVDGLVISFQKDFAGHIYWVERVFSYLFI